MKKDSLFVKPRQKLKIVLDDPDDDKFINCALEGKAKWIISGDKHLLNLKTFKEIKIFSPREFLEKNK